MSQGTLEDSRTLGSNPSDSWQYFTIFSVCWNFLCFRECRRQFTASFRYLIPMCSTYLPNHSMRSQQSQPITHLACRQSQIRSEIAIPKAVHEILPATN